MVTQPLISLFVSAFTQPATTVSGTIVAAGFGNTGNNLYRPGYWYPLTVQLSHEGQFTLDDTVIVEQYDRDGDLVVAREPIALSVLVRNQLFHMTIPGNPDNITLVGAIRHAEGNTQA